MAAHSNSSLSPLSSKPINPNPRNPETNSTIRRSFTATNKPSPLINQRRLDPFTPANSPSEFGGRRCVDRDCEEKENGEKDCILKASKLQSPAKGCKNFIAPTISAASKFTPSPRKKVLVDRNEPVRTSISFSDGKAMFFSNENMSASVVETHPVSKPCKKVTFSDESVITDSDGVGVESKVVQSPIDVDPCLPPYDPKTNYLSPRPQFIRYKPNPIVEMLLNKEKGMDSDEFEYSLMAEMFVRGLSDSDEASADMVVGLNEERWKLLTMSQTRLLWYCRLLHLQLIKSWRRNLLGVMGRRQLIMNLSCLLWHCRFVQLQLMKSEGGIAAGASVSVTSTPSFDESLLFIKDLSLSDLSSSSLYEQSRAVVASARSKTASDTVIQTVMDQSAPVSLNQETDVETAIETSPDSAHMESESMQNIQIHTDMDQSSADPQNQETEVEAEMEMEKSQVDINVVASDNVEMESSVIALAITFLLAGVVGVAVLVYKRFPGSSPNVVQVEQVVPVESNNGMKGSYHERSGGGGEVVSSERKARRYSKRESLASSSGSPSYGSFTTYERIPPKANGYGEEEIMTPVRRSSRIRKKVT
ncbi:hypothetical protein SASPL_132093 [Salvia splendens]|uniref:Uncharacterized protein n=1 Tax=Salvia splendens TaxID=180675 RepID=A0A8X8ZL82_SALSN|nr:hypothetical protein SASPL_132093 [Salvia splendens]